MASRIKSFNTLPVAYERQDSRKDDKKFYASATWRKLRAMFLAAHPLCNEPDCGAVAKHVHHVVDRKAEESRALDWDNLEALCLAHHNARRATA